MVFKINISTKDGKTYKLEAEAPLLNEKKLGDIVKGIDVSPDLAGYELQITGASDKSGFASMKEVQGIGLGKHLLGYGKGMHKRPKGDKKVNKMPNGLRLRKTVRGNIISDAISQINTKVVKEGAKPLKDIFGKGEAPSEEAKPEQTEAQPVKEEPNVKTKDSVGTEPKPEEKPVEKPVEEVKLKAPAEKSVETNDSEKAGPKPVEKTE